MPRRALLVTCVFLASLAPAVADDPPALKALKACVPEASDHGALVADAAGRLRLAFRSTYADPSTLARCEAFLDEHRDSPYVVDVLQALVGYHTYGADQRIAALCRIRDAFPEEYATRRLATLVPAEAKGLFAELGDVLYPQETLDVAIHTSCPTTITAFAIPAALCTDALRDLGSPRTGRECALSVPRARWVPVGEFGRADARHVRIASPVLGRPGWLAFEESISGITKLSLARVETFEPRFQLFGHDVVCYAVDNGLAPITDITLTTPSGTFTPDTRGFIRTTIARDTFVVLARGEEEVRWFVELAQDATVLTRLHVSTDRPLYRPGHSVHYKAVRRDRVEGRLGLPKGAPPAVVEIVDPDERVLSRAQLDWNAVGTVSGTFVLADEPRLGNYAVRVVIEGGVEGSAAFEVLAYAKPEFLVTAAVTHPGARPGTSMSLRVSARYYFGAPVVGAEVEWSATPISRSWWSRYQRRDGFAARTPFEDPYRWYYARAVPSDEQGYSWHDDLVGTGRLGPDGTLAIALAVPEDSDLVAWKVSATVTDAAHRSASMETRLEVPTSDLSVTAGTDTTFVAAGAPVAVRARVAALPGVSVQGRAVELAVFRVRSSSDDGFGSARVVYDPISLERGVADAAGLVSFELRPRGTGRFGYRARVADDRAREADAWGDIVILPPEPAAPIARGGWMPWTSEDVDVLPERMAYSAGATARLLVHTKSVPARAFVTVGGASLCEARWVDLVRRDQLVEVSLPTEGPNAYVGLTVYGDDDEHYTGVELAIVPVERLVDVVVRLESAELAPRGKARLVVETRQGGKPVPAEVALSIVDRALLALSADKTPTLSAVFEPFVDEPDALDVDRSFRDEFRAISSGAVGGAIFDSADGEESGPTVAAPLTRKLFPDTWHWNAHLATGIDGTASLELDVPDSLTRWRVLACAVVGSDGFGQVETDVCVTQPVVLRLVAPRFLVQGDKGTITTVLTSDVAGTFAVSVAAGGRESAVVTVDLAAGGSAQQEWPIAAGEPGTLVLAAKAVSRAGGDAIELTIPVLASSQRLEEIASGAVRPRWSTELVLPADADAKSAWIEGHVADAPTLDSVQDALPYLADFPYGCVEQTMSRFLPTLVVMRAMARLKLAIPADLAAKLPAMISAGLQRLYHFQHSDGGWGWWERDETHPRMTAYAMYGLLVAREAGVHVDATVLDRGLEALRGMEATPDALYVRALGGEDVSALRDEAEPTDDGGRAWLILAGRTALAAQPAGAPPRRTTSDTIANVALAIRALAKVDAKDPRIEGLVDWLGLQRRDGQWVSTLDTAHAIYALCDVCTPRERTAITVTVNGQAIRLDRGRLRAPAVPGRNSVVVSQTADARVSASAFLRYPAKEAPRQADSPLAVVRRLSIGDRELTTGAAIACGEEIAVEVRVTGRVDAELLLVECPIPAGCEAVVDPDAYDYYARLELRDDRVCAAVRRIGKDESFELRFHLRALQPGTYHLRPATAAGMYDPTIAGASESGALRIEAR